MRPLQEILKELSQLHLQVKLSVGYADAINGYGWHTVYYVDVLETIEFCEKCRRNKGVDYLDDYYPNHHQHSHRSELKSIFNGRFRHDEDLVNALWILLESKNIGKTSV
jgi:hypothetical protein